jgi:hypothetical protein
LLDLAISAKAFDFLVTGEYGAFKRAKVEADFGNVKVGETVLETCKRYSGA